jgi:hypothetical protein
MAPLSLRLQSEFRLIVSTGNFEPANGRQNFDLLDVQAVPGGGLNYEFIFPQR